ncbi:MAG: sigma-70 family RNA polymerase sigma factor [Myxococcaceae bacterium]|nr:sigma-70 family RNA polymerase sigma factor [Myxococcaceae bacterium]
MANPLRIAATPDGSATDEELFARFRDRRDVEALGQLYDLYEKPLVSFAARMLGSPRALADDVLQETGIRAMQSARDWSPHAPLRAWLFRIARNLCLDTLRARGVALDDGADPSTAPADVPASLAGYPVSDPPVHRDHGDVRAAAPARAA